jgi:hypothetical protein
LTDIAFGVRDGKVVMTWREPATQLTFEPQNAYEFGERIARAAHEARYGKAPPDDRSYLAAQVKSRITEDLRTKMISRVAIMLPSMAAQNWSPGRMAMHVVDAVLKEVT